jgi:hypothetical protein
VLGGANAPWEGGRTPGGGAFSMLRLLRRRLRPGDVGAALTVPEELTDCIDSLELLLVCCCTFVAACTVAELVGLTARRVNGLVTAGVALG